MMLILLVFIKDGAAVEENNEEEIEETYGTPRSISYLYDLSLDHYDGKRQEEYM